MSVLVASGVVCGKEFTSRDFINEKGQADRSEFITVTLADSDADGAPLSVVVSKEQFARLEKFKPYQVPVQLFTFNNKKTGVAQSMIRALANYNPVQAGAAPAVK
jgi:hypothetical protein